MSGQKVNTTQLRARKGCAEKIAVVTAYDATIAGLLDEAGVDVLMVGDSLGMVVQGNDDTLSVTLDEMAYHCRAVRRGARRAHVVCDLPFMTYQVSPEQALGSAGRLMKEGGAESVKLEGGELMAPSVRRIVSAGIPVMGHIGLTPQSVHHMGGFRIQGKTHDAAQVLMNDARALEEAGVYALVIEGVPADVADSITRAVGVPTIGIGAGPGTDGQVLVCYDLLGMYGATSPRFVRRFRQLGGEITAAAKEYVAAVREGSFPAQEHSFAMAPGEKAPQA
jgi:3-methyl-2-oxobutanoate hydroxymethyltransferase